MRKLKYLEQIRALKAEGINFHIQLFKEKGKRYSLISLSWRKGRLIHVRAYSSNTLTCKYEGIIKV